jgi:hypothetical protein
MAETLTTNQSFHLILADIAMAAAIRVYDREHPLAVADDSYRPGCIRDGWLDRTSDQNLRQKVTAMATAGMGSLQRMPAEELVFAAQAYGVPLGGGLAESLMEHFSNKRDAVLTYRR